MTQCNNICSVVCTNCEMERYNVQHTTPTRDEQVPKEYTKTLTELNVLAQCQIEFTTFLIL